MPSIKASRNPNLAGWRQVQNTPQTPPPDPGSQLPMRSTLMHAPMPLMASAGDALVRQFYGGMNVPAERILPAVRVVK